ncbi:inner membrane transport protein yeaN [Shigella flexneri 2a]|nr:inner membrane transport protein yeaN [Shigella flexneri 2a]
MTCSTSLSGKNRIVLIAGILMIATTLRVTFTGAAPLLDTIRSAYSLTTAQTGLLTTLPLLAFALISPLAATVAKSATCKFEYLTRLTYSGYLAFATCLAGNIVSWDQLTGLLRDYWLASGDPHQSRL